MQTRKADHSIVPPIVSSDCHTLVLGSMLSPKSAEARFYYAHPQNRFWRVMGEIFGKRNVADAEQRTKLMLDNGIALWDVISSCDIVGASDSTIKNVVFNDIAGLLDTYSGITRIFTTGKKAYELLMKYNRDILNPVISAAICLPSTSPQNCKTSLQELIQAYSVITKQASFN